MAKEQAFRTTVSSGGAVNVLQRPSLLMMVVRLRANESTLELGLANLNEQREAATKWLNKLGVLRIEFATRKRKRKRQTQTPDTYSSRGAE